MASDKMNPKVDEFLKKSEKWHTEFEKLREIALECDLTEELKWGVPCYTFGGKNVILIHGFKDYCAILFVKGALLKDPEGILVQQTENVQAGRQIRFTNIAQIIEKEAAVKAYIHEAIDAEKAGLDVEFNVSTKTIPEELQRNFDENPGLKSAFEALTPGRQRAYLLHFSQPKQSATRESRIQKAIPQILNGKGLND